MHEDRTPSESALELRLKQVIRYVSIALVAILAICGLMFAYINTIKQNEQAAISNTQALAAQTNNSSICAIFPEDPLCVKGREVAANPTEPAIAADGKDGRDGQQGPAGRGVSGFATSAEGDLIVTYTDGQTQNVGRVVGKDGKQGIQGEAGRGILSTELQNGNLIVNFTDGKSENMGMIVGPAGADGSNGLNGQDGLPGKDGVDGQPGRDGISITSVALDSTNSVIVSYSDGRTEVAGQLIINTIKYMQCQNDTLTIGMVDGTSFTATVDCTPDNLPVQGGNTTQPITIP